MRLIDVDKWEEIFDTMRRHKLRTFLTALSVWWGIFMLIILLGAGSGLENSVVENFGDDAINSIWMYRGMTSVEHNGLPPGRRINFSNADYEMLKNDIPGIDHVTGRYYLRGDIVITRKHKSLSYSVRCVHPDHQVLENTLMPEGRFINQNDIDQYRKVCIIGKDVRESFFDEDEIVLGTYIKIKDLEYQIVGVFDDTGNEREVQMIYIPISTCQKVYEGEDRIHQLMMTVGDADLEESQKIEQHVRAQMASIHKFSINDDQAIYLNNGLEDYAEFKMVMNFIQGFIWFVGIGSIIAGMIGVSNIMLIVVKDRTREIGIRKALGATPGSIIAMVMQESVFITAVAGYMGLLMGFGLVYGLNYLMISNNIEVEFFYNPEVRFSTVMIALVMLVVCGALAGLLPALQAVKVHPVIAMKDV
ncbi:MAG: ABC transporter permease [Bacteroidetes bacterium]|nr:MAG: ABC transporter permease [Bacteroidota bacterium]